MQIFLIILPDMQLIGSLSEMRLVCFCDM